MHDGVLSSADQASPPPLEAPYSGDGSVDSHGLRRTRKPAADSVQPGGGEGGRETGKGTKRGAPDAAEELPDDPLRLVTCEAREPRAPVCTLLPHPPPDGSEQQQASGSAACPPAEWEAIDLPCGPACAACGGALVISSGPGSDRTRSLRNLFVS